MPGDRPRPCQRWRLQSDGALLAAADYDMEYKFIETQAETDFEANIQTCADEVFEVILTVGFLIADATRQAAEAQSRCLFPGR